MSFAHSQYLRVLMQVRLRNCIPTQGALCPSVHASSPGMDNYAFTCKAVALSTTHPARATRPAFCHN